MKMISKIQNNFGIGERHLYITSSFKLNKNEIVFCVCCFWLFFVWACTQQFDYAPDELMRFQIPYYIYEFGNLPNGWDPILRNEIWGFSYAFYPFMIGPLFSALFMKITSFFTLNMSALLIASRFTSVICGTITVYFTIKISKRLFNSPIRWIMVVLVSTIPQFVFLSSYVNNDIIALASSAIILYSWIVGIQDGWNLKSCTLLAVGIIICMLSYYNAYGWILCSIFVFFVSFVLQNKNQKPYVKKMWKQVAFIIIFVAIFTGYFFIRNMIIYNGDFLGINSLTQSSELYALNEYKPSMRNTPSSMGISVFEMLFSDSIYNGQTKSWLYSSFESFVGVFGYMQYSVKAFVIFIYKYIFAIGFFGVIVGGFIRIKSYWKDFEKRNYLLIYAACLICIIIPFILSVYYSYTTDYQPQGRYLYPMLMALMLLTTKGLAFWIYRIPNKLAQNVVVGAVVLLLIICIISAFAATYLPSLPNNQLIPSDLLI